MTDAIADASSILEPEGRNVGLDLVLRHGDRNVDVTAGGLGVGAHRVSGVGEHLGVFRDGGSLAGFSGFCLRRLQ